MYISLYENMFYGSCTVSILYGIHEVLPKIYLGELYVYGKHGNRKGEERINVK